MDVYRSPPISKKIPWFENFARPRCRDISMNHEIAYDQSILLESLMDPAHIPISHDRMNSAKQEDATALFLEFEAPCVLQNNSEIIDNNGKKNYFSGLFLCRPSGVRKSMLTVRFGNGWKPSKLWKIISQLYFHGSESSGSCAVPSRAEPRRSLAYFFLKQNLYTT
ncbi:hypothetical protein Adt_10458 [Abeliophyllum distichum]|uniref:Pheophorbide a oxygenase domain-containing protein n=1 Tax=Abeliophyllum distichum TaxID=126358 RepID=A0ABD1UK19_9LAMI